MIYLKMSDGVTVVVLETANLTELMKGRPAHSPDNKVLVAWTPDMPWLAAEVVKLAESGDFADAGLAVGRLIDAAAKRPENPTPPRK